MERMELGLKSVSSSSEKPINNLMWNGMTQTINNSSCQPRFRPKAIILIIIGCTFGQGEAI